MVTCDSVYLADLGSGKEMSPLAGSVVGLLGAFSPERSIPLFHNVPVESISCIKKGGRMWER